MFMTIGTHTVYFSEHLDIYLMMLSGYLIKLFFADFFFRIFALATVMSSVLIYNLPETVSCPTSAFARIAYGSRNIILITQESKTLISNDLHANHHATVKLKTKMSERPR